MARIGFDVDGVFADLPPAFQKLLVELTGKDLFLPGDSANPPCWNWHFLRGYTKEEADRAWVHIANSDFWRWLQPIRDNTYTLSQWYRLHSEEHDVYFITHRAGARAKQQTERWLQNWAIGSAHPTVLLSGEKGTIARALNLDVYIDDNLDNAKSVLTLSPKTKMFLLNRSYNQEPALVNVWTRYADSPVKGGYWDRREATRVATVEEFLIKAGLA